MKRNFNDIYDFFLLTSVLRFQEDCNKSGSVIKGGLKQKIDMLEKDYWEWFEQPSEELKELYEKVDWNIGLWNRYGI